MVHCVYVTFSSCPAAAEKGDDKFPDINVGNENTTISESV